MLRSKVLPSRRHESTGGGSCQGEDDETEHRGVFLFLCFGFYFGVCGGARGNLGTWHAVDWIGLAISVLLVFFFLF